MAISPVVGVMLMLVVTIIIAAVVTGFAGGLVSGQKTAPTLRHGREDREHGDMARQRVLWHREWRECSDTDKRPEARDHVGHELPFKWHTFNRWEYKSARRDECQLSLPRCQYGVAPFGVGAGVGVNGSYSVGSTDSNRPTRSELSASTSATIP